MADTTISSPKTVTPSAPPSAPSSAPSTGTAPPAAAGTPATTTTAPQAGDVNQVMAKGSDPLGSAVKTADPQAAPTAQSLGAAVANKAEQTPEAKAAEDVSKMSMDQMQAKAQEFAQAAKDMNKATADLQKAQQDQKDGKATQQDVDKAAKAADDAINKVRGMIPTIKAIKARLEGGQ